MERSEKAALHLEPVNNNRPALDGCFEYLEDHRGECYGPEEGHRARREQGRDVVYPGEDGVHGGEREMGDTSARSWREQVMVNTQPNQSIAVTSRLMDHSFGFGRT